MAELTQGSPELARQIVNKSIYELVSWTEVTDVFKVDCVYDKGNVHAITFTRKMPYQMEFVYIFGLLSLGLSDRVIHPDYPDHFITAHWYNLDVLDIGEKLGVYELEPE